MSLRGLRELLSALLLLGAGVSGAEAATVYTYSFTQDFVYSLGNGFVNPATLVGGFAGTTDATGHVSLNTLSDFHLTFDRGTTPGIAFGAYAGPPEYFSFLVGDASGGTLTLKSPLKLLLFTTDATACVGAAVAFLCNGGSRGVVLSAIGVFARSEVAPVLTLVSATTVAVTPIPAALLLFGTAIGGLGAARAWRRKSVAAGAQ